MLSENNLMNNVIPLCFPKTHYDNNSQDVILFPGLPIISKVNDGDFEICNNETFKIKQINYDEQQIIITDDEFDIPIPFEMFQTCSILHIVLRANNHRVKLLIIHTVYISLFITCSTKDENMLHYHDPQNSNYEYTLHIITHNLISYNL